MNAGTERKWIASLFAIATRQASVGGGVGRTKTERTQQHAEAGQIVDDGCNFFGLCFNGCPQAVQKCYIIKQ